MADEEAMEQGGKEAEDDEDADVWLPGVRKADGLKHGAADEVLFPAHDPSSEAKLLDVASPRRAARARMCDGGRLSHRPGDLLHTWRSESTSPGDSFARVRNDPSLIVDSASATGLAERNTLPGAARLPAPQSPPSPSDWRVVNTKLASQGRLRAQVEEAKARRESMRNSAGRASCRTSRCSIDEEAKAARRSAIVQGRRSALVARGMKEEAVSSLLQLNMHGPTMRIVRIHS